MRENILTIMSLNPEKWFPVFYFYGEMHIPSENRWVYFSHRACARLTELFQDGKITRQMVKGQTGAKYYTYKYIEN